MSATFIIRSANSALLALMFTALVACNSGADAVKYDPFSLIPQPVTLEPGDGEFLLSTMTGIVIDPAFGNAAEIAIMFNGFLKERYGITMVTEQQEPDLPTVITATRDSLIENPEAYRLEVRSDAIAVTAGGDAGLFYGIQTLIQLIYPSNKLLKGKIAIPCVNISDAPQYKWRGMHLDVSRHFFPKEFIFRVLDAMAMHKLNTFHWHLTDDQGWRIEIEKYPELASVAAWRDETLTGHGSETPWVYDGTRHGGYYTKQDVRDVVEYASRLHINVLPEIEMPGHAVAALQAYPQLSCTGGPVPPFNRWGVSEDVFCAGKEETYEFLEGVLSEVAELFPYEYIHIGGDECPKVRWEQCPSCQKKMADNDLKDEHELQSYLVRHMEAFLATKGKKIIGWDEILEGGIADNAAVMSWRGHSGGIHAANMGHDVVMTPHSFVYLDYYQSEYNEPLSIGGMLPMDKVYSIDIMPSEIDEEKRKHIIGAQANLWTEYIADEEHVEYMLFPRLAALAEALWTPNKLLEYEGFERRMAAQYVRYDAMGIKYRVPYPQGYEAINLVTVDTVSVELTNGVAGSDIFYTTDGSEPDERSKRYDGVLALTPAPEITLKSVTVMPGGRKSAVMAGVFRKTALNEPAAAGSMKPGLSYTLYRGEFGSVMDIGTDMVSEGVTPAVRIPDGAPTENFGLQMEGYIMVPSDGIYSFYTNSDDGVRVWINDELVVDGDKFHHGIINEGRAALKAGIHNITVRYFQRLYRQSLSLNWEGPGVARQPVPAELLFHHTSAED